MNTENLKRIIDQISRDKGIERSLLVEAIEEAVRSAARKKYGSRRDIEVQFDEETGEKEAELTGDEAMVMDGENMLVFNPKQQSTIEALVNKGDANGLMKKMKALLKKFNKENV